MHLASGNGASPIALIGWSLAFQRQRPWTKVPLKLCQDEGSEQTQGIPAAPRHGARFKQHGDLKDGTRKGPIWKPLHVDMLFLFTSCCVVIDDVLFFAVESSLKAAKIQRVKEEGAGTTLQVVRDRLCLFLQAAASVKDQLVDCHGAGTVIDGDANSAI